MKKIIKLFKNHSVSVSGVKGSGKDMLFSNIVARRKQYYISNADYKCRKSSYIKLDFRKLKSGNTYKNFLDNAVKEYVYPYPDGTDIYISDCGIYFPCQYNEKLNREYEDIITFVALSRQLGNARIHTNAQAINRVWDKLREQSDIYIVCQSCKVIFGIVFQRIRIYERYESAEKNVPPLRVNVPLLSKGETRAQYQAIKTNFEIAYGKIKSRLLIYRNKSKYDTRLFKSILEGEK